MVKMGDRSAVERVRELLLPVGGLIILSAEPLARHTRFGIGGPADLFVSSSDAQSFQEALEITREHDAPWMVIGGGTNLITSDAGFPGVVLQYAANRISGIDGTLSVDAGAVLQDLVDHSVARGLKGFETMTGIPGWVGAAVYGNAGAYGHSMSERTAEVRFFDGSEVRTFSNRECDFRYRESIFKKRKEWTILSCTFALEHADAPELKAKADSILTVRNEKYPPTMKCAGSIFKNFLFAELPASVREQVPEKVIREGKVPSAWFLQQVGAKGMRVGDIQVASYHANLIYNDGSGTARDLVTVIHRLKQLVGDRFGIPLEEEVQYVGDFEM
jgi:UDP-N-acetylmuramate dehydrogenase